MSKKLKIVFTVSVLLNLLLAGTLAGYAMRCRFATDPMMDAGISRLSTENQALVKNAFEQSRAGMKGIFKDARAARADVIAVLEAEPFDAAAFREKSAVLRGFQMKIMERRTGTAGELAGKLDTADRKAIAEWLAGPGGKPPGRRPFGPWREGAKHGKE